MIDKVEELKKAVRLYAYDDAIPVRVMGPCGNLFEVCDAYVDEDGFFVLEFE